MAAKKIAPSKPTGKAAEAAAAGTSTQREAATSPNVGMTAGARHSMRRRLRSLREGSWPLPVGRAPYSWQIGMDTP